MGAVEIPAQCAIALKEWATVLEAMARGQQVVLIRKGGLMEPGSGFGLVSNHFLFYPTFEHQAVQYLRPDYRGYFDKAAQRRAPEGQVRIQLAGLAVSSHRCDDPTLVQRLARFHIYNEAFVSQRLKWQPEQPLIIVVVRAFQLARPQLLPVSPRYAGCKSWVNLDEPVALEGVSPVLEDPVFLARVRELSVLLP